MKSSSPSESLTIFSTISSLRLGTGFIHTLNLFSLTVLRLDRRAPLLHALLHQDHSLLQLMTDLKPEVIFSQICAQPFLQNFSQVREVPSWRMESMIIMHSVLNLFCFLSSMTMSSLSHLRASMVLLLKTWN